MLLAYSSYLESMKSREYTVEERGMMIGMHCIIVKYRDWKEDGHSMNICF